MHRSPVHEIIDTWRSGVSKLTASFILVMKLTRIYCGLDSIHADKYGNVCMYNGRRRSCKELALILAAECFPNGHTVYEANGRWNGRVGVIDEPTIIVEIMTGESEPERAQHHKMVQRFAGDYKNYAKQESVLITSQEIDAFFV